MTNNTFALVGKGGWANVAKRGQEYIYVLQGREDSMMHAVFHMPEEGCHYSPGCKIYQNLPHFPTSPIPPGESRKTRAPRSLSRNRGNLRGNSRSRSRSRR